MEANLILLTLLIIILVMFLFVIYAGLFTKIVVRVTRSPMGAGTFIYKFYNGPYQGAGKNFGEVVGLGLTEEYITIGIHYDDPEKVPKQKICYAYGLFIEKSKEGTTDAKQAVKTLQGKGYSIFSLPSVEKAVVAEFPFTLGLSIVVAGMRVYPALKKYITENNLQPHPFLEVYAGPILKFFWPLEKNKEFYVPEFYPAKGMPEGELPPR